MDAAEGERVYFSLCFQGNATHYDREGTASGTGRQMVTLHGDCGNGQEAGRGAVL